MTFRNLTSFKTAKLLINNIKIWKSTISVKVISVVYFLLTLFVIYEFHKINIIYIIVN